MKKLFILIFLMFVVANVNAGEYNISSTCNKNYTWNGTTNFTVYSCLANGTFNVTGPAPIAEILIVGGGGSASYGWTGGGGGAGGVQHHSNLSLTNTSYTIVVGNGGARKTSVGYGNQGQNSSFAGIIAVGGGYGSPPSLSSCGGGWNSYLNGSDGGSGGGNSRGDSVRPGNPILTSYNGSVAYGSYGARGNTSSTGLPSGECSGGGGGAGGNATLCLNEVTTPSNGGPGILFNITGTPTYYAGGGGGSSNGVLSSGGLGNNCTGGNTTTAPTDAPANSGGGGCGPRTCSGSYGGGGAGGSGIVIIKIETFYDDPTPPNITINSPTNTTYNNATQLLNITSDGDNVWYNWNGTNVSYEFNYYDAWNVTSATYLQEISVRTKEVDPTGVFFKPDGTKMYVVGYGGASVDEWDLDDAWNVSSAVYLRETSVKSKETNPQGVFFKPDGTKMYVVGYGGDSVYEWDLADAWNVSSATYLREISVASKEDFPSGVFFKPDGTKMYVVGGYGASVYEWDLTDAWNVSSATYLREISVASKEIIPTGVFFKPDGTKMYVVGGYGDSVYEWDLTDAWNVSSATYLREISVASKETSPQGVFFKPDGTKMYVVGGYGDSVYEWDLVNHQPLPLITFSEGTHTLTAWANDSLGNVNTTSVTFTIDTTAPTLVINTPTNTTYNNATQLLNITSDGDNVWYNWNGTNITYTTPVNIIFDEGENTINVWANDTIGNSNTTSVTFTIDTTPPLIEIISPEEKIYNTSIILINITNSSADLDTIWYEWNGTNTTYLEEVNTTFPDGNYTLEVWGNDTYGNVNYTNVSFSVDTTFPTIEIVNPTNTSYNYTSILLNITSDDLNPDTIWYNWNGTNATFVGAFNLTFEQGSTTIHAWVNDTFGNSNYTNVTFFIDSIAPNITVYSPIENKVYTEDVVLINITASDLYLEDIWYNWNGTNYTYTEAFNITVSEGNYTLNIWANDSYGNVGSEVVEFSYFIPNLFANFTGLDYGIYYFNATVTNGTHNFSTDTYVVNLSYLDWGTLNYPVNESEDVQIQEVNFTLNDIFYTDIDGHIIPVNITIYLNDSLIYNETLNETQDIILNYSALNYSENTWYNLTVNYSDIITNDSKYYLYKTSHLYGEINLTENTDEGIYVNKYYVDAEAEILNNFTAIENVTIYLWNASDDTLLNQTSGNDTTFNANFTGFNSVGFFELLINATAVDIDSNELYVLNSKYLNITNNIPSCSAVNYTLNYSEGIAKLNFKLSTWKQYGVSPVNQTSTKGALNITCDEQCEIWGNFYSTVNGFDMKLNIEDDYQNAIKIDNSTIYSELFDGLNGSNMIWLWGDFNRPTAGDYNITIEVCKDDNI